MISHVKDPKGQIQYDEQEEDPEYGLEVEDEGLAEIEEQDGTNMGSP
jgi:hypothetical protein